MFDDEDMEDFDDEDTGHFPMADDFAEDPEEFPEQRAWLKNTQRVVSVKVVDEWSDDHEPCYDLILTNENGEELEVSLWWTNSRTIYRAESGQEQDMQTILHDLLSSMGAYPEPEAKEEESPVTGAPPARSQEELAQEIDALEKEIKALRKLLK